MNERETLLTIRSFTLAALQTTHDLPADKDVCQKLYKVIKAVYDRADSTLNPPPPPYKAPKAKPFIKRQIKGL